MESTPVSSSCSVRSARSAACVPGWWCRGRRYLRACAPWLRTACRAAFIMRGSFMASKTRNTSMPFSPRFDKRQLPPRHRRSGDSRAGSGQRSICSGVLGVAFEFTQANPRVFAEEANARRPKVAPPQLQRPVAHVVELSGNRQHIVRRRRVARDWWASRRTTSVITMVMDSLREIKRSGGDGEWRRQSPA